MITAIEIENFKGFGERQRIELSPITLLFGANSAGKSSFFHALFLLKDFLNQWYRSIGVQRYATPFDLGDFENYVHKHDLSRTVRYRFEFDISEESHIGNSVNITEGQFDWGKETLQLEFGIRAMVGVAPWCSEFRMFVENKPMLEIATSYDRDYHAKTSAHMPNLCEWLHGLDDVRGDSHNPIRTGTHNFATPGLPRFFSVDLSNDDLTDPDPDADESDDRWLADYKLDAIQPISEAYEGSLRYLSKCLDEMLYIGPLREVPLESQWKEQISSDPKWEKGLSAWRLLSEGQRPALMREKTNRWLDRLQTHVSIESHDNVVRIRPEGLDDDCKGFRIQDVGIGISQVVPLIASLCDVGDNTVLFEQPELHLHPRVQTELGDLLIETCVNNADFSKQVVIETHSEHLVLRLLRRIRETTEGEAPSKQLETYAHQVAVHYFLSTPAGTQVTRLRIDETGEFIDRWPSGFFDERAEELF